MKEVRRTVSGFQAQVRWKGKTSSKGFSIRKLGGVRHAKAAALAWQRAECARVGKPFTDRYVRGSRVRGGRAEPGVTKTPTNWMVSVYDRPGHRVRVFVPLAIGFPAAVWVRDQLRAGALNRGVSRVGHSHIRV